MRRIFYLLFLMVVAYSTAQAYDYFWYQGLYYHVSDRGTAEVVSRDYYYGDNENYSGNITIPRVVYGMVGLYEYYKASFVVTSIGEGAFQNCTDLTSIEIPNTVTYISKNAFSGCVQLTEVNLPDKVNYIGDQAFAGCTGLTNVTIPNSVRTLGWNTFYGCTGLTHVTLSQSLRQLSGTFAGCTSLTSVDIPRSVTVLDGTFTGCAALTAVDLPSSLTTIGERTFDGCSSLTSVYIPNSVTSIGNMAFSNTALTDIEIPASVSTLGENAFYGCDQLGSVTSRSVNPPVMANSDCFSESAYALAMLVVPAAGYDSYRTTDWWNLFDAENFVSNPALDRPYDFAVGGLYYIITGPSTVSVTSKDGGQYSGAVTVPATVRFGSKTYSVTAIGTSAFSGCTGLTSVNLPGSLTTINAHAFQGCFGLQGISLPESLTAIGDSAFMSCGGITSLTVPAALTTLGENALKDLYGLTTLAWNARNCYTNGSLNFGSSRLTTVTIGEGVQTLPNYFVHATSITSIDFPSSLKSIGYGAFWGCNKLTSLVIPEGVEYISTYAFSSCTSLTSLTWNARECWTNGDMYTSKLSQLTIGDEVEVLPIGLAAGAVIASIDIPESVRIIGAYAFSNCLNVTEIMIPDQVTMIGWDAFFGCEKATSIVIGKGVEGISEQAFAMCDSVTSLTWNARYCLTRGNMPTAQIEHLTIGNEVTLLPKGLAAYSQITEVSIPNSVKTVGNESYYNSGVFEGCTGLTHVELPPSVERIYSQSFSNCTNLANVTLSDSLVYIGNNAFEYCSKLQNITLPASLDTIESYAFGGSGLTELTIPNSVTCISSSAFASCVNLTHVNLPAGLEKISNNLFSGCRSLQEISIPSTVRVIDYYAFSSCQSLRHVTIPPAVVYIGSEAFYNCRAMTSLTLMGPIPTSDEYANYSNYYLGSSPFYGCTALTDVTCRTVEPPKVSSGNFYVFSSSIYDTATLHVPAAAIEAYRNAYVWKSFTNIEGMPGSGPGDVNGDGKLDVDDVTVLIGMLLNGETLPAYADVNGDGLADIDDVALLITMLLNGH